MTKRVNHPPVPMAALFGVVLAGGQGTRLGRDKGSLVYHGKAQARWAVELLAKHCERAYVSIRREQASVAPYNDLPLVIDDGSASGPGAGLLAAFRAHPDSAWLAIGVDMPLLDHATLAALVRGRDPACVATAYRHPDGTPEPLCTIWEPAARARLESLAGASSSPRRELEKGPTRFIVAADATRLRSVNTPEDDAGVMAKLAGG